MAQKKRKSNKLTKIVLIFLVLVGFLMIKEFTSYPEKYLTTWRYQLQNELKSGNAEAWKYYKETYLKNGVILFEGLEEK